MTFICYNPLDGGWKAVLAMENEYGKSVLLIADGESYHLFDEQVVRSNSNQCSSLGEKKLLIIYTVTFPFLHKKPISKDVNLSWKTCSYTVSFTDLLFFSCLL